ncbi:MAG TPA: molybdopterin-binding protein [Acidimicrobiia bacterium]|nr:molybdopterin-binding protein [Acidimicrobiia bacterium]
MIVEVVSVGSELLLGDVVNTNAAVIGRRLADEGFDSHHQVVVGDNLKRLIAVLETAVSRADAVIITGGIGPTQDDLTREALCELAGVEMTRDQAHAEWIGRRLRAQGREPSPSVLRMADLPGGAEGLRNVKGVALGVAMEHDGCHIFAVPGVPQEMIPMVEDEVMPRLRVAAGEPAVLRSRLIHCWGLGESAVADILDDMFAAANPSVAFLIRDMEVRVRVTAKGGDEASALEMIAPVESEIRRRLGDVVFAVDEETVEEIVLDRLHRHGWTVATVEDATLGQIGARLAAADSRSVLVGAVIRGNGAVARPEADVVLEVGPIGPDATDGPRTTRDVTMTVETPEARVTRRFDFGGDDERLRAFATAAGLHALRTALESPAE